MRRRAAPLASMAAAMLTAWAIVAFALPRAAVGKAPVDPRAAALQAELLATARATLADADRLGAKKTLPNWHDEAAAAVAGVAAQIVADTTAARAGTLAGAVRAAEAKASRLLQSARLVNDLRRQQRPWQAVADAYDRDLRAGARAVGVDIDPALGGAELARAAVDSLGRRRLRCLGLADSLNARQRTERETLELELTARDSTLAALSRRLSDLQQSLWEMELRAGVVETDRVAAEARLRAERERADLVRRVSEAFVAAGGVPSLSPAGDIVLRHADLAFAAGKTDVTADMERAVAAIAVAATAFPDAPIRVEGHTDNSGSRAENLRLAKARAEAVAAALRTRLGMAAPGRVSAVGVGPDRPLVANATAAGREKNRRIEVVITRERAAP